MSIGMQERVVAYRDELSRDLGRVISENELRYVPLSVTECALLVNPFVLTSETSLSAFRKESSPFGFQILTNDQGEPHLAIRLFPKEVRGRLMSLTLLLSEQMRSIAA